MPGHPVSAGILVLLLFISGCVSQAPNRAAPVDASHVELNSTPFHPQTHYHCGPSALATVLGSSGLDISPERMAREVYLPGRKGTLQLEIIAAVRRHGRIPYQLDGNLQAVLTQLYEELPVLVLLNQGIDVFPAWHYATVIGYQPGTDSVILRSGTDYRLEMPRRRFENDWKKAGYWSLVVLHPGQFPASVDMDRYLDALITMEAVGQWKAVEAGHRAATATRRSFTCVSHSLPLPPQFPSCSPSSSKSASDRILAPSSRNSGNSFRIASQYNASSAYRESRQ